MCCHLLWSFFFYRHQNRLIGNTSIILKTEQKATFVDGSLSLGIASGIFFLTTGGTSTEYGFIPYLADSIVVLILAFILIKEPLIIIKESLIELAGGKLQDQEKHACFEKTIYTMMPHIFNIEDIFISKNGSQYMVLIYISTEESHYLKKDIFETKHKINNILGKDHPYLLLDIIPEEAA